MPDEFPKKMHVNTGGPGLVCHTNVEYRRFDDATKYLPDKTEVIALDRIVLDRPLNGMRKFLKCQTKSGEFFFLAELYLAEDKKNDHRSG